MSLSVDQILTAIAPQLISNPYRATFFRIAKDRTNIKFYGANANLAIALRMAHMMTLAGRLSGDAGAISSKREGELAVTYANGGGFGADLLSTNYGSQLNDLRKGSGAFIGVTGGYLSGCRI
jgi:hypothetical protein